MFEYRISAHCLYCSNLTCKIIHFGKCPKIKTIKYYPDGATQEVEFFNDKDVMPNEKLVHQYL